MIPARGPQTSVGRCTLYCIVLYCIVLYCIVLYCIVSWWARLSTGASREAPVDNECLGNT